MNSELKFFVRQVYEKPYFIQPHTHPCHELVYYLSGKGKATVKDASFSFSEGSFIVNASDEIHSEESTVPTIVLFIGFSTDRILPKTSFFKDQNQTVLQTMLEIEWEMKNKQNYYSAIANLLTEKLLYLILRTAKAESDEKEHFKYILNYIDASANQKISVRQMAYNLGYNYDYFRQLFLKQTGKTAKDYLTNLRLNNVKRYLANFDYSLEEIAAMTGFSSSSHLCMTFKKHFGISPLVFKTTESKDNKTDNLKKNV